MSEIEAAVEAIRAGRLAIVPTDTVYGLAASAYSEGPARRLYRAKGREEIQPTALVAADVDMLLECIPELRRTRRADRAGSPTAATHADPAEPRATLSLAFGSTARNDWSARARARGDGAGPPVPSRAIVATSANLPGGPDPSTIDEVPEQIRAAADAIVDAARYREGRRR